jgi:hypothetical protein
MDKILEVKMGGRELQEHETIVNELTAAKVRQQSCVLEIKSSLV